MNEDVRSLENGLIERSRKAVFLHESDGIFSAEDEGGSGERVGGDERKRVKES